MGSLHPPPDAPEGSFETFMLPWTKQAAPAQVKHGLDPAMRESPTAHGTAGHFCEEPQVVSRSQLPERWDRVEDTCLARG